MMFFNFQEKGLLKLTFNTGQTKYSNNKTSD